MNPGPRRSRSGLVLLIVAGISTLCGWVLALPAVIFAAMSMGDQSSPARSMRLVRWGWIAYAIAMTLFLIAAALLMTFATLAASGNPDRRPPGESARRPEHPPAGATAGLATGLPWTGGARARA